MLIPVIIIEKFINIRNKFNLCKNLNNFLFYLNLNNLLEIDKNILVKVILDNA